MRLRDPRLGLVATSLAVGAWARWPLHRDTWALPLSNDDAIPLLIARRLLGGEVTTTLWNQPYNGTLDAWLLAPFLSLVDAHSVFRVYELLGAILLVLLVAGLARALGGAVAGWCAAAVAACGPPYMDLMAALGPTPNFLIPLLTGAPLLYVLSRPPGRPGSPVAASAWGLVVGLATWNSALALPALVGSGAGLLAAGRRPDARVAGGLAGGFALGASPSLLARLVGATAASPVTSLRPPHMWDDGLSTLASAAVGLFGGNVPLVIDGPERVALPPGLAVALAATLVGLAVAGGWRRDALPLVGWAAALAAAFALARRSGPDEIRYLYGVLVPGLALAGVGLARAWSWYPPAAVLGVIGLVLPWATGHRLLQDAWRDPEHASRVWQVPSLEPVRETLGRARIRSAYASLQFAGRLQLETAERVIASQAFNERMPGDPLRFRDEVDLDPAAAWVLSPHLSRGMPRAAGLRALIEDLGGTCHEDLPGAFVVFRSCSGPYDEGRAVPREELRISTVAGDALGPAVLDRDPDTGWRGAVGLAPGSGLEVALASPRRLSALVLAVELHPSPLGVPRIAEVDGEVVERAPRRFATQWINGGPRMGRQALLVALLGGRTGQRVRLLFQGGGPPLAVRDVFLYGPEENETPDAGDEAAAAALDRARAGDWHGAEALYREALRLSPERASYHAAVLRAQHRAASRAWLDVESLDDGGPELLPR